MYHKIESFSTKIMMALLTKNDKKKVEVWIRNGPPMQVEDRREEKVKHF